MIYELFQYYSIMLEFFPSPQLFLLPLSLKVAGKTSNDGSKILSLVQKNKKDEDSFTAYAIMAANETGSLVLIVIVSLLIEAAG